MTTYRSEPCLDCGADATTDGAEWWHTYGDRPAADCGAQWISPTPPMCARCYFPHPVRRRCGSVVPVAFDANDEPMRIDREVIDPYGFGSHTFYGYVENMFDPIRIAVRADSIEDAYAALLTDPTVIAATEITETDRADYPAPGADDDYTEWTESGQRLDTESVRIFGPVRLAIRETVDLPAGF